MGNEKGKIGKLFVMVIIILVILGVCGIMYLFVNSKETGYMTEPPKEKIKKDVIKTKYDKIEEAISSLDYSKVNNNISNEIILIDDFNKDSYLLVSTKTGEVLEDDVYGFEWYGNFGITDYNDCYNIIDKNGNVLFSTMNGEISFFPETKLWGYYDGDVRKVFDKDGMLFVEDKASIIDDEGVYFYTVSDKLKIYDYNKKLIYEKELDEDVEDVYVFAGSSTFNEVYALIEIVDKKGNSKSAIINLKDGNIVYDYVDEKIILENNNLFSLGGKYMFIHNDKVVLEGDKVVKDYGLSDKYVNINDDVYDLNTMKKVDSLVYMPLDVNENLIQRETGLEITVCLKGLNIKYGLKYKDNEVIPCENKDVSYYDYEIHKELFKSNKLYVMVSGDDSYIYDVYKKVKFKETDQSGLVIDSYENEDSYFYNILNDKSVNNKNGEQLFESFANYYVLTDDDETYYHYYDTNFEKFYEIKK